MRAFPDGEAALAAAASSRPMLALLDGGMPTMDGFELLARLRALPTTATFSHLVYLGWGPRPAGAGALELGANDYIVKPFAPAELVARVRRLVTG